MSEPAALRVEGLTVALQTRGELLRPVRNVNFTVRAGETLGLVGESGCGKTLTALAIMRLLPSPPARLEQGRVLVRGTDLASLSAKGLQKVRGTEISMIFQEPMTSLDPVFSIGHQMTEMLRTHTDMSAREAEERAIEMLRRVQVSHPRERLRQFPHELSGGMIQRVMIAIALSLEPAVLIADEPTTALDVTVQAEILRLMKKLQEDIGMALVLISHNLGVVSTVSDRVVVMYAGEIVEIAASDELFEAPRHPYTRALLDAMPSPERKGRPLATIPGRVPAPAPAFAGCAFRDRCEWAVAACSDGVLPLTPAPTENHQVRCIRWRELDRVG